jgi:hypothetical protein
MILRMATKGKLESSKVIDVKDYKQLEQKIHRRNFNL